MCIDTDLTFIRDNGGAGISRTRRRGGDIPGQAGDDKWGARVAPPPRPSTSHPAVNSSHGVYDINII
jgi:hypothetical protein